MKYSKYLLFSLLCRLFIEQGHANQNITKEMYESNEVFLQSDEKSISLFGKLNSGRYFSSGEVFSCSAVDFGRGKYVMQDFSDEHAICVAFYNGAGSFVKAEILIIPGIKNRALGKDDFKGVFDDFAMGILKTVDHAKDVVILKEEMLGAEHALFMAVSVRKMTFLKSSCGKYMPATRGYLVYQENDKFVILSNQIPTLPGQKHIPRNHLPKLKEELLEFKKTCEFQYDRE
jgi:hypothetical protein